MPATRRMAAGQGATGRRHLNLMGTYHPAAIRVVVYGVARKLTYTCEQVDTGSLRQNGCGQQAIDADQ